MAKNLNIVLERVHNLVQRNFSASETLRGLIEQIEPDQHRFMLKDHEKSQIIECRTFDDISRFQTGTPVIVQGTFCFYPKSSLRMYLLAEYVHSEDEKEAFKNQLKIYNGLKNALSKPKCQRAIRLLGSNRPPSSVYNVGLIAMACDAQAVDNFRTAFAERCNGKLFIFRLRSNEVSDAMEMFKKFHNIDLICLLTLNQAIVNSYALSTKTNVVYMLNRTSTPYTIAVTGPSATPGSITPLTSMLANKQIVGIDSCIKFIQGIQSSLRTKLVQGISDGQARFDEQVRNQRNSIFQARRLIAEMVDPRFDLGGTTDRLSKLKQLLIVRLSQEKNVIAQIQRAISLALIDDKRIGLFLSKMFIHEQANPVEQIHGQPTSQHQSQSRSQPSIFNHTPHVMPPPRVAPPRTDNFLDVFNDPAVSNFRGPIGLSGAATSPCQKIENKMGNFMDDALGLDILRTHGQ